MVINATLIVQACNLFVTFWIVRFLLITPVIKALSGDQESINSLHRAIERAQRDVVDTSSVRESCWQDACDIFKHEQPNERAITDVVFRDITPSIETVAFSQRDQKLFIEQSTDKLVARLKQGVQ